MERPNNKHLKKIKAVIFDLDGTIGNTIPLCLKAFRKSMEPLLQRSISDEEIIATFGPSEEGTIMALAPNHYDKGLSDYLHFYEAFHEMCPAPFEGIKELLDFLQNNQVRIAMVTGKGKYSTAISLEQFGLSHYFEIIETGMPGGPRKAEGIQAVLDYFEDIAKSEIVYIGDAPNDILACNKVGISVLSAAWADTAEPQKLKELKPEGLFYSVEAMRGWLMESTQTKSPMRSVIISLLLFILSATSWAATGNWASTVTGSDIVYTSTEASSPIKDYAGNYLTVIYLENLGFNKIGKNSCATDVAWLLSQGYRVIELNYANSVNAVTPKINADIIAINKAINSGSFCGLSNCSKYKSYVLFEGYRMARDVSYFKDDPTVYNYITQYTTGDSLHMDIIYPANASVTVPVVLSFSYSNSYPTYDSSTGKFTDANRDQRLNLGNTLAGFNDTFLEGAPANGIAWAIADHPKYCVWGNGKPTNGANKTYASYETNPDAAQKVKSAVRTLRVLGTQLGLSGKIGIYGFSRGSTAGSMAVGDRSVSGFENAGLNIGISDDVQVAALGSGVFDYTQIYNTAESDIGNLTTNCPLAWGALASNQALWQSQGSYNLAQTSATAPVMFFYNTTDAAYYQDQIKHFKAKLDSLGVPTSTLIDYGTGHSVPQTDETLSKLYDFFNKYLKADSTQTDIRTIATEEGRDDMPLTLSPNPAVGEVQILFNLAKTGPVQIELYSASGTMLYKTEKYYDRAGWQKAKINLDEPKRLQDGIYYVKVAADGMQGIQKLVKAKS
jgi:phosphoglycolate phosphatase-like HAD superfamily hydrolase/dienelactone hydrolase